MIEARSQTPVPSTQKRALIAKLLKEKGIDLPKVEAIARRRDEGPAPLTSAQRRLWFLDQLEPGNPVYNIPAAIRFEGSLNVAIVEKALAETVARHDSLRTTFTVIDERPVQTVSADKNFRLQVIDLAGLANRDQEALRLAMKEAGRAFNLAAGPLFRASLIRLGDNAHVLLVVMHHIISDGWSKNLLVRDFIALYQSLSNEQPSPLAPLPVQYADYAYWEDQQAEGPVFKNQLSYWTRQLGGVLPVLELPADHPRPAARTYRGSRRTLSVPEDLYQSLKQLSSAEGASLFMTMLAAFNVFLHRYTGQTDIIVGTPVDNRNRLELEGLVGMFVNTLALRADIKGNPTFRNLLRQVRERALDAYANRETPFEKIVDELQPERSLSHAPLFQVMLAFQTNAATELPIAGLKLATLEINGGASKFDLSLDFVDTGRNLAGVCEYSSELFEDATVRRFLDHFMNLLQGAAADPEQRVSELPLLSARERDRIFVDWNATDAGYPLGSCVHDVIARRAEEQPHEAAVVFEDTWLSYRDLNERANRLANYLIEHGVEPETLVGIATERSLEMIVGLLAILKAGAAFVPIDPTYPQSRIEFMIEDSAVKVMLTQKRFAHTFDAVERKVISLDSDWKEIAALDSGEPRVSIDPANVAYVIYTSGSTGKPKGAMNTHRGLENRLRWMQQEYRLHREDVVLQKTPMSFDVSVWEYFWPLMAGSKLVVARPGGHQDPTYLVDLIKSAGVTLLHFVPSMLQEFVKEPGLEELTTLRQIICSGEALSRELVKRVHHRLPQAEVDNLYGPTEAAIDVTKERCRRDDNGEVSIGRPIGNIRMFILNEHLKETPIGVSGELFIAGAGVGRGYWRRADLTAEKFAPNPYGKPGSRMYNTGDLARFRSDGRIDYLGRIDGQIKIRGMRIELGEIEAAIEEQTGKEAVVVVQEHEKTGKMLVAYVADKIDQESLKARLREKLPVHMVPAVIESLDDMPRLPNGKVDRKKLSSSKVEFRADGEYEDPRGEIEEHLARIWSDVLGDERISRNAKFFEVGGNSLSAIQVVSRVRRDFNVDLQLRLLFEGPTIAALANRIHQARLSSQGLDIAPIQPMPPDAEAPLSFAQRRMWFLSRLNPGDASYNMPVLLRFDGPLDLALLERSLNALIERHEILRTVFPEVDGAPVQRVSPAARIALPLTDLTGLAESKREAAGVKIAAREAARPFDVEHDLLIRGCVVKTASDSHLVALTLHHIVSDGWSIGLVLKETAAIYEAFCEHRQPALSELPIQYKDFAYWQRHWARGELLESQLAYWKQRLGGTIPQLDLPGDGPRSQTRSSRGARFSWTLSEELSKSVAALSCAEGTTLFMTLLAAFQTLLHRYTGQEDIIVGSPIADRPEVQTESLIGCFLNMLPLRTNLSSDITFKELLRRVRETTLEAYANKDLPFEEIVEALRLNRAGVQAPLFRVTFALHNNPPIKMRGSAGLTLTPIELDNGTSQFDLLLLMGESEHGMNATFMYGTDRFGRETIARMSRCFEALLADVVARPNAPLGGLDMLDENDKRRIGAENTQRLETSRQRFLKVKPKAIKLAHDNLVKAASLFPDRTLPLLVEPVVNDLDLTEWMRSNTAFLEKELLARGAVLFRNFAVKSVEHFEEFVKTAISRTVPYHERSTPRTEVGRNIYTSTEYPPDQPIALHNEFSYSRTWPMKISFYCARAPQSGGETPIADCRQVYNRIPAEVRNEFAARQVAYVRNYSGSIDLPWQTVFQTSDKREVEEYCRRAPIDFEWVSEDHLRTKQVRQAVATHPVTGETVWFNQAHLFHVSNLESDIRESLLATFEEENLPRNAYYGDGAPIEDGALDEINRAFSEAAVLFQWREGDILLLDNMLTAHGRTPFTGARRILTAMGDPITQSSEV